MKYVLYASEVLLFTLIFSILGVLIASWMEKNGFARKDYPATIIGVFGLVLIKNILFQNVSWWLWSLVIILGIIFALNRYDLWVTMNKGRWWWKTKNRDNS